MRYRYVDMLAFALIVAFSHACKENHTALINVKKDGSEQLIFSGIKYSTVSTGLENNYLKRNKVEIIIKAFEDTKHKKINDLINNCLKYGYLKIGIDLGLGQIAHITPWESYDCSSNVIIFPQDVDCHVQILKDVAFLDGVRLSYQDLVLNIEAIEWGKIKCVLINSSSECLHSQTIDVLRCFVNRDVNIIYFGTF